MKIIISSGIDGPSEIKNLEQIAVRQSKKKHFSFCQANLKLNLIRLKFKTSAHDNRDLIMTINKTTCYAHHNNMSIGWISVEIDI